MVVRVTDEATAWWPSRFGPDDQLGMLNHITDASRAAALGLVRSGRVYDLGRVLHEAIPVFPGRYFRQTLVTTAHHGNHGGLGANRVNWITEIVAGTQQLGTHLDALSHLQIGDRGYNGADVDSSPTPGCSAGSRSSAPSGWPPLAGSRLIGSASNRSVIRSTARSTSEAGTNSAERSSSITTPMCSTHPSF
jgi:hypothetical protein